MTDWTAWPKASRHAVEERRSLRCAVKTSLNQQCCASDVNMMWILLHWLGSCLLSSRPKALPPVLQELTITMVQLNMTQRLWCHINCCIVSTRHQWKQSRSPQFGQCLVLWSCSSVSFQACPMSCTNWTNTCFGYLQAHHDSPSAAQPFQRPLTTVNKSIWETLVKTVFGTGHTFVCLQQFFTETMGPYYVVRQLIAWS